MKHYLCIVLYNFSVKDVCLPFQHAGGDTVVEDEPKFKPFTGSGKRLDGRASRLQASEVPSTSQSVSLDSNKRAYQQTSSAPATSGASNSTRQKTGKLVFGSSASNNKEPQKVFPYFNATCYRYSFVSVKN
jgi:hypothetical protein